MFLIQVLIIIAIYIIQIVILKLSLKVGIKQILKVEPIWQAKSQQEVIIANRQKLNTNLVIHPVVPQ